MFLSNGPGDPEPLSYAIETIRNLIGKKPVFGICLGHQLLGLAVGAKTFEESASGAAKVLRLLGRHARSASARSATARTKFGAADAHQFGIVLG